MGKKVIKLPYTSFNMKLDVQVLLQMKQFSPIVYWGFFWMSSTEKQLQQQLTQVR